MKLFWNLLRWCIEHWKLWGLPTITVSSVIAAGGWILAVRKRRREAQLDVKVIRAMEDRSLWRSSRPMTGAGVIAMRSAEIAEVLSADCDAVADSLERLESRGRVRNAGGTLDNPAPYWHVLRR